MLALHTMALACCMHQCLLQLIRSTAQADFKLATGIWFHRDDAKRQTPTPFPGCSTRCFAHQGSGFKYTYVDRARSTTFTASLLQPWKPFPPSAGLYLLPAEFLNDVRDLVSPNLCHIFRVSQVSCLQCASGSVCRRPSSGQALLTGATPTAWCC